MYLQRSIFSRLTALLAVASLAACSSSKKEDPTPATREISWTADGAFLKTSTLQSQKFPGMLSIAGTVPASTNPTYLALEFPNAVGTYTFSTSSSAAAGYTVNSNVYYAGSSGPGSLTGAGTIVVTTLTATDVTGTFTFTAIDPNTGNSKSITNGKFSVGL